MYEKCERLCVIGSATRCVHACIRACVHACMRACVRAHTSAYTFAAWCRLPNNVRVKQTVSHDTPQHGLEFLLLPVQSQRTTIAKDETLRTTIANLKDETHESELGE